MTQPDGEFLKQLIAAFREEAEEHLRLMEGGLIKVERTVDPHEKASLVETVFREAHSFKGAARAVNLGEIERVCQTIESVCASWKKGERHPDPEDFDGLHRSLDALRVAVAGLAQPSPAPSAGGETPATAGETVRMGVDKIEKLLREAEELVAVKLTMGQRAVELSELVASFTRWQAEWARVQPDIRALRQALERDGAHAHGDVARLTEFCEWNFAHVHAVELRMAALAAMLRQDQHAVGRLVDDLLDDSKKLMVLPFSTVTGVLPKLVRDLCREQGKEAEVVVRGDGIEVDKRILEEMKDPFVHLVRNCVDHGLEVPAERIRQGKPARGTIRVTVTEAEGRMVEIVVADDGAGIDVRRVREAAVRRGVLTAEAAGKLDDDAVVALTFQSDVSTRETVSAISGRGLGLAIVREKAEKLGGRVVIENRPGLGASFRMVLPLAVAVFRGILVEVAGQVFVIPAASVERVVRVLPEDIKTVENRETITVNGMAVSLARLEAVLELTRHAGAPGRSEAVVLVEGGKRIAFDVDAVLNETEVLVKPLARPLVRVRNVAGATILGSGRVVPILNVSDLMKAAASVRPLSQPPLIGKESRKKTVLIVEDSITSRMLLKSILESAGYRVRTAVDGAEAFATLKTEPIDAVVSDIEMPRLNGFGLTAKIREDRELTELPVVLVTALESETDRQRGAEVGANAYIVKSSFDQSDLLAALERLV